MKNLLIIFVFAITSISFSQNLNDYKYAQVPSKFNVFKEKDEYRLNTLARLYMQKFGFETYLDTDVSPTDFASNSCNKVYVDVLENNSLFQTKITILLKDCKNNILFTSKQGTSREKEYKVSYTEAFREAFESLAILNHKYVEKKVIENVQEPKTDINNQEKTQENRVSIPETEQLSSISLVAEAIENGFLIINPKLSTIVLKLYKTTNSLVYIANSSKINGVVLKKGQDFFIEYYKDKKLVSEKLNVSGL